MNALFALSAPWLPPTNVHSLFTRSKLCCWFLSDYDGRPKTRRGRVPHCVMSHTYWRVPKNLFAGSGAAERSLFAGLFMLRAFSLHYLLREHAKWWGAFFVYQPNSFLSLTIVTKEWWTRNNWSLSLITSCNLWLTYHSANIVLIFEMVTHFSPSFFSTICYAFEVSDHGGL